MTPEKINAAEIERLGLKIADPNESMEQKKYWFLDKVDLKINPAVYWKRFYIPPNLSEARQRIEIVFLCSNIIINKKIELWYLQTNYPTNLLNRLKAC